jgi:hypothetical protein
MIASARNASAVAIENTGTSTFDIMYRGQWVEKNAALHRRAKTASGARRRGSRNVSLAQFMRNNGL